MQAWRGLERRYSTAVCKTGKRSRAAGRLCCSHTQHRAAPRPHHLQQGGHPGGRRRTGGWATRLGLPSWVCSASHATPQLPWKIAGVRSPLPAVGCPHRQSSLAAQPAVCRTWSMSPYSWASWVSKYLLRLKSRATCGACGDRAASGSPREGPAGGRGPAGARHVDGSCGTYARATSHFDPTP